MLAIVTLNDNYPKLEYSEAEILNDTGIEGAYKICTKCNREFQNIYDGICHLCWNKIYNDSDKKHQEFKTYRWVFYFPTFCCLGRQL